MLVDAYSSYVNNFAAGMDEIRIVQQSRPNFVEFLKVLMFRVTHSNTLSYSIIVVIVVVITTLDFIIQHDWQHLKASTDWCNICSSPSFPVMKVLHVSSVVSSHISCVSQVQLRFCVSIRSENRDTLLICAASVKWD